MAENDVILSGILRKKKSRINTWVERYFVLRGQNLEYFVKSGDTEPKGVIPLNSTTQISKISSDVSKKRKQFVFKLTCRVEDDGDEVKDDKEPATPTSDPSKDSSKPKGSSKKKSEGGSSAGAKVAAATVGGVVVGALTAGVGLLAGMMVVGMGAAAGGGAVAMSNGGEYKEKTVLLACDTYNEAETWANAIETQIQESADNLLGLPSLNKRKVPYRSAKQTPLPGVRLNDVEDWIASTRWKVCDIFEGVRILEPITMGEDDQSYQESFFNGASSKNIEPQILPCLRINLCMNASASEAFSTIINFTNPMKAGIIHSLKVIQNIDNVTDIVHLKLHPVYLYPTWTAPRDFCLLRYWRDNSDGSYVICLDSTTHADCPPTEGYVRGELHAAYVIAPPKKMSAHKDDDEEGTECMISFIAQADPKGWIWQNYGYQQKFLREFMLQILDVRDALESDRFLQVHFDPVNEGSHSTIAGGDAESGPSGVEITVANTPPPILPNYMWAEPDAASFKVRGKSYNADKVKTSSAPNLFKLACIDFFEVNEPTPNISAHPRNRVAMAAQRGDPSWMFVLNIMVPGPPFLSFVSYWYADKSIIDADTPFGRIARPFFYGNDDEFRNNRFKLIPKVVDGNMIIKMAVKDTPTLLGNKLKQYYFKGDNYFELVVDVGSSSVARNVVGLAIGYSKTIVVDMGLCLQGNDEDELPEVIMGGCTCINVDSTLAKKL